MTQFPSRSLLILDFSVRFVGIACYTIFIAGVYGLSGNAFQVGLLGAMTLVPALAVSLWIGKIIERFSARPTLSVLLIARLMLFATVAVMPASLWSLLLAAAANSLLHQTSVVVKMSLDSALVTDESRTRYLSSKGMQTSLILTVAPALGGILYGWGGLGTALGAMCIPLVLAVIIVNLRRLSPVDGAVSRSQVRTRPSASKSWNALRAVPGIHVAVMLYCLVAVILETEAPLTFPFVDEKLGQGASFAGILLGVGGLGGVGGAWLARLLPRILVPGTIKWLILFDGILFYLFTLVGDATLSICVFAALGAMGSITLVIVESVVQKDVETVHRPFVFSLMQFSAGAGGATVGILAAFLASQVGTPPVLAICALLEIAAAGVLIIGGLFRHRAEARVLVTAPRNNEE